MIPAQTHFAFVAISAKAFSMIPAQTHFAISAKEFDNHVPRQTHPDFEKAPRFTTAGRRIFR